MAFPAVTYTFVNGSSADAGEVNTNFQDIINGISDGTKDISINAATIAGTASFNGDITLGNGSGDTLTINASLGSTLLVDTNASYDLGSSTAAFQALYLDNNATDGGAIYFDLGTTEFLKSVADGSTLNIGGFTGLIPNAAATTSLGVTATPFTALHIDNTATDGGAIYFDAGTTEFIKSSADGTTLTFGGFTGLLPTADATADLGDASTGFQAAYVNKLYLDSNSQTTTIAGSASASASVDYFLPAADGSANQVLKTDGSGALSFNEGPGFLDTDHLLASADFPDTTNLYGWNDFDQGTLADADWIGSEDLTDGGTIAYATDHLGTANNALDFDGTTDYVYPNSATFDTANESFTVGLWINLDAAQEGTGAWIVSKQANSNLYKSFSSTYNSDGSFDFTVFYNNSGGNVSIVGGKNVLHDNLWHHLVFVYDQANTSIGMYLDGMCIAYEVDSNLSTRNNSSTVLMAFGTKDPTSGDGGPANYFDGQMSDLFYKKTALSANEIRKIYAAGSQRLCLQAGSTAGNSTVAIADGRRNNGAFYNYITSSFTVTATTVGTAATGYTLAIPETGRYRILASLCASLDDTTASAVSCTISARLVIGSTEIAGTTRRKELFMTASSDTLDPAYRDNLNIEYIGFFEKDDIINVQAWKSTFSTTTTLEYSNDVAEPYMMWEKLD